MQHSSKRTQPCDRNYLKKDSSTQCVGIGCLSLLSVASIVVVAVVVVVVVAVVVVVVAAAAAALFSFLNFTTSLPLGNFL